MRKGFTLIELLAVILILGIISLIAIPTVSNILKESKKNSFNASVKSIASIIENKCSEDQLKGIEQNYLYTIDNNKITPNIDVKGKIPDNGYIAVDNNCEANIVNVTNGEYYASGESNNIKIDSQKNASDFLKYGKIMYSKYFVGSTPITEANAKNKYIAYGEENTVIVGYDGYVNYLSYGFYSNSTNEDEANKIKTILNNRVINENFIEFYPNGFEYFIDYDNNKTFFIANLCPYYNSKNSTMCVEYDYFKRETLEKFRSQGGTETIIK